jgi:hypothetical protein
MNEEEIRKKFPRASQSFVRANRTDRPRETPQLEPDPVVGALGEGQAQAVHTGRFLVRIEAVRVRLIDQDNLCEKYHVDCLRYAGLIPDDSPDRTQIEVTQRKAKKGEEEHVIVSVEKSPV